MDGVYLGDDGLQYAGLINIHNNLQTVGDIVALTKVV